MVKTPSGNPEGCVSFLLLFLSAVSIAIIKTVGLPVALSGPVVARIWTLRYSTRNAGANISVVVLPDIVGRANVLVVSMVANA